MSAEVKSSSTASLPSPPLFHQTVTYLDWNLGEDGRPIVRIFGSTPAGQKSLLHLHDCYPYLYCDIPPHFELGDFLTEVKHRLENFLRGDKVNKAATRPKVFRTSVEKDKVPVYGYAEPRDVCKIQLYDPGDVRKACEYLMNEQVRVYNANVGYLLQVMVDLDLAGMDLITCSRYCFRGPMPPARSGGEEHIWTDETPLAAGFLAYMPRKADVNYEKWWAHASRPARTSTCELELDVHVEDVIILKRDPPPGSLASKRIKFIKSLGAWWTAEESRRKAENFASDFDREDEEQENNHIDTGASFVEDPFMFRKRVAKIAEKMRDMATQGTQQQQVEYRRSQTQSDFCRSSPGEPPLVLSQDTLEAIRILDSWQEEMREGTTTTTSPARKTVKFVGLPEEEPESSEDEEEEERGMWDDILASQKEFVESGTQDDEDDDDQLDGGVFDSEDTIDMKLPIPSTSASLEPERPPSPATGPTPQTAAEALAPPLSRSISLQEEESTVRDQSVGKTSFFGPAKFAPLPFALHSGGNHAKLAPVSNAGRGLFYSDPSDVPIKTADEFHNYHAGAPVALLDSLPSVFEETGFAPSFKRSRWFEPVRAAPVPSGDLSGAHKSATASQPPSSVKSSPIKVGDVSQLSQASSLGHATPGNPVTQNPKKESLRTALEKNPENNHLTLLGMEVFARNRSTAAGREGKGKPFSLLTDPAHDPIGAIFYCVRDDQRDARSGNGRGSTDTFGMMYVLTDEPGDVPYWFGLDSSRDTVKTFPDELALFHAFIDLVRTIDPDVLMGWEVQKDSLGYLLARAKVLGEVNLPRSLSRVPYGQQDRRHENDEWGDAEHSGFWIPGRHIFNLWRVCREELKLYTYTIHQVLTQLTGDKIPKYSPSVLTGWWDGANTKFLVVRHFKKRVLSLLKICDHLDILGRSCELSRLFGMDLFSVMTRGSQFRVEAVLLRICKGLGYLMLSPTRKQVASQPAMEAVPLIFEPKSAFYSSPVLVMDFRSLYPSVIIANNICFSTCLGRMKPSGTEQDEEENFIPGLGVDAGYSPPLPLLTKKEDYGFVSPNGVCFVSKKKREGVLPRMLREILDTRVMIKKSVEGDDVGEAKKRVADARQFGLKMIANVTYGYTAASFSGRMPCAEIADAIVQTGRACLELAVRIVHDPSAPWGRAECVYGDTDSLFVHLPGKDLEEARVIGKLISDKVSQSLPRPMKLQFEKVFFPCVLQVKKRYVGWKFPSRGPSSMKKEEEEKGTLDAKGIETIRRDGCPAVVKALEYTLKEIFTSKDLSKVKVHLRQEFEKMFAGTASMSNFILTGKVKLGSYAKDRKNRGNYPPAAVVADKMMRRDPRAKPVYKERVSYVVACGPPGSRLIDLVVDPHELMVKNLRVNVAHYIDKLILPALDRLLGCASVDVRSWFSNFEKTRNLWGGWRRQLSVSSSGAANNLIHRFFDSVPCVLCAKQSLLQQSNQTNLSLSALSLCSDCAKDLQRARYTADVVMREAEKRAKFALSMCGACVRRQGGVAGACGSSVLFAGAGDMCLNVDCEDFFTRRRAMDRIMYDVETLGKVGGTAAVEEEDDDCVPL